MGRLFVVIKEMLLLYFSPKLLLCRVLVTVLSTFLLLPIGYSFFCRMVRVQFSLLDILWLQKFVSGHGC